MVEQSLVKMESDAEVLPGWAECADSSLEQLPWASFRCDNQVVYLHARPTQSSAEFFVARFMEFGLNRLFWLRNHSESRTFVAFSPSNLSVSEAAISIASPTFRNEPWDDTLRVVIISV